VRVDGFEWKGILVRVFPGMTWASEASIPLVEKVLRKKLIGGSSKKEGAKAPFFFCLLVAIAPFVIV
jgi:hypothetical protein